MKEADGARVVGGAAAVGLPASPGTDSAAVTLGTGDNPGGRCFSLSDVCLLYVGLSVCLSVYMCVCLSVCPSVCPLVCLSRQIVIID